MRSFASKTTQLMLAHVVIVMLVAAPISVFAWIVQQNHWRSVAEERIAAVSFSVATLPEVRSALQTNPGPVSVGSEQVIKLGDTIEAIRRASEMDYVVVLNPAGMRLTHVLPGRVGKMVSTDPALALSGGTYVGVEDGEVGRTFRVKVPVYDDGHNVIGVVSTGVLESQLTAEQREDAGQLITAIGGALIVGGFAAAASSYIIRRRIYAIEPAQVQPLRAQLAAEHSAAETLRAHTHEFANRLHVIQGLLLQRQPEKAQEYIAQLPGTATGNPAAEEVVGNALLDAVIIAKRALATEMGRVLELDIESDASQCTFELGNDEVTVLSNLLTNALEATSPGGHIEVGIFSSARDITICVQDDGTGLDASIAPLEAGVSTKAPGRGVGLSLVHTIVVARKGTIRFANGAIGGAEFEITLPAPSRWQ